MIDITRLQAELEFTDDPKQIVINRKKIEAAGHQLEAQKKMLFALAQANEDACSHSSARHGLGRDSSGSHCDTCGKSW
jgi:hypothetical protein